MDDQTPIISQSTVGAFLKATNENRSIFVLRDFSRVDVATELFIRISNPEICDGRRVFTELLEIGR